MSRAPCCLQINSSLMADQIVEYFGTFDVHLVNADFSWVAGTPFPTQGVVRTLQMPVGALITADAVASRCTLETPGALTGTIRQAFEFTIQARDIEGLPLVSLGALFHTYAVDSSGASVPTSAVFYIASGRYQASVVMPERRGNVTIRVTLEQAGVEIPLPQVLNVSVACPVVRPIDLVQGLLASGEATLATVELPAGACGCPAGFRANGGTNICLPCEAGYSSTPGQDVCAICPRATYAPAGSPQCYPCRPGTASDKTGTTTCTFCDSGKVRTRVLIVPHSACATCATRVAMVPHPPTHIHTRSHTFTRRGHAIQIVEMHIPIVRVTAAGPATGSFRRQARRRAPPHAKACR